MNYREYLLSPSWKRKKNQVKYWHGNRCHICNKRHVDIHHKTYKDIGNENQKFHLIPLCRFHHEQVHIFCRKEQLDYWHGTEKYIKLHSKKKKKKRKWNNMTPFEREQYLGKGL